MAETSARFQVSATVVAREIAEGLMLVDVQTGAAFKLNHVGAAIWRRLDGATDVASIVSALEIQYPLERGQLLRDVDALLGELRAQSLIHPIAPG